MKIFLQKTTSLILFIIVLFSYSNATAQNTTVNYTIDNTTFGNPERGFWLPAYPLGSPLNKNTLITNHLNAGYTLVPCRYILSAFRSSPLSQAVLDQFQQDLNTCRDAGVKMVPAFWYNEDANGADAPYSVVINHLEQLKPILQSNEDVIAYWAGGLIGAWGEWHTSSNNLIDNSCFAIVNANTIGIQNKILEVLPKSRMTVIRTPRQWFGLYGRAPVTYQEAFTQTNKARSGMRNHYFSGNLTDGSTWMMPNSACQYVDNPDTIQYLKTFNRNQCAFTVYEMEADTPYPNTDPVYAGTTSLQKMEYQRLSTGNVYFNATMINRWKNEGVFNEMARRMGYHFKLISSSFPSTIPQGSNLSFNVTINNDGFASPYNPRDFELVLRAQSNGAVTRLKINRDPRYWLPDSGNVSMNVILPISASLPAGQYDLLLNFPDPIASINTRPEYSIRLANQNVWEASTGYNSLLRDITITTNSAIPTVCVQSQAPVIDGTEESLWTPIRTDLVSNTIIGTVSSSTDLSSSYKVNWNSNSLFVFVKVKDDTKNNDSGTSPWDDDAIEFFIDGNNDKAITYDANDHQYFFRWNDNTPYEYSGTLNASPTGVSFSQTNTADGYQIEAKIDWTTIGVTPSNGKFIGIDVQVNDDDDGGARDSKITAFALTDIASSNPSVFGTLKLDLANCNLPTGVAENKTANNFTIYPNPANQLSVISYQLLENSTVKISIYDVIGKEVMNITNEKQNAGKHNININTADFQNGIYFVKMNVNEELMIQKLIISK